MFIIKRLVGDSVCHKIGMTTDLETAMQLADENAYDEEPGAEEMEEEDFSWEDYEGFGEVIDEDHNLILYWCNGEGKCGTDLTEEDEYYEQVMNHINPYNLFIEFENE